MKKIAFISTLEGIGGTECSLLNLLKKLPEHRYNVDLILLGKQGVLVDKVPKWINIIYVKDQTGKTYIKNALKNCHILHAAYGIYRSLQLKLNWKKYKANTMYQYTHAMHLFENINETYDVAITWYVPNSYHTVYTLEKIKSRRKVMWIHMDVCRDYMPFDALEIFNCYDKIYCVSTACKKSFDYKYPECANKSEVFYNILDDKKIIEDGNENVNLVLDNRFKIMTCGRIAEEKQPMLAIKIVEQLLRDGIDDFVWYFIGAGALREQMQTLIMEKNLQKYIVLVGATLNPYAFVSKGDLYVQMSIHESYCLTLAEAVILGTPSISTNFPSAYEILEEGYIGYIVEKDWKSIYEKVKYLLQNKNKYEELKENIKSYHLKSNGNINQLIQYLDEK